MGTKTGIDWTEHTWSPWQGCHKIATGCLNCYMHRDKRRYGQDPTTVVRSKPPTFNAPLKKWHDPALVFVCSWSDFFVEEADPWRAEAWDIIRQAQHLTFQILTKRVDRIKECLPPDWGDGWPHVWLGASASNQPDLERVVVPLLRTPAAVRFLSLEPLLGPIDDLREWLTTYSYKPLDESKTAVQIADFCNHATRDHRIVINLVIAGCESGPNRREAKDDWFRSIRDQCVEAGVPFFLKQQVDTNNKMVKMPELDGRVWDQMPQSKGE